jgi:hypothetical protein
MTTPLDAPDWRKMSQEEWDRGLNNSGGRQSEESARSCLD